MIPDGSIKGQGKAGIPEDGALGVYLKITLWLPNKCQFLDSKNYTLCHLSALVDLQYVTKELTFSLAFNP